MTSSRQWHLPDYAQHSYEVGAALASPTPARQAVVLHRSPRGLNRVSAQVVYLLVLVTSAIALVDLYLLSTAIPRLGGFARGSICEHPLQSSSSGTSSSTAETARGWRLCFTGSLGSASPAGAPSGWLGSARLLRQAGSAPPGWLGSARLGALCPVRRLGPASRRSRPRTSGVSVDVGNQQPTVPSTSSRIRSAWPLWRAYSSIMCT